MQSVSCGAVGLDVRLSGRRDSDVPQARMHAVPAAGLCRRLSQVVLSQRDSLLKRSPVTTLLTENRLNEYLHRIDIEARETVLKITETLATARGMLST